MVQSLKQHFFLQLCCGTFWGVLRNASIWACKSFSLSTLNIELWHFLFAQQKLSSSSQNSIHISIWLWNYLFPTLWCVIAHKALSILFTRNVSDGPASINQKWGSLVTFLLFWGKLQTLQEIKTNFITKHVFMCLFVYSFKFPGVWCVKKMKSILLSLKITPMFTFAHKINHAKQSMICIILHFTFWIWEILSQFDIDHHATVFCLWSISMRTLRNRKWFTQNVLFPLFGQLTISTCESINPRLDPPTPILLFKVVHRLVLRVLGCFLGMWRISKCTKNT